MNTLDRRHLLTTAVGAGAVVAAGRCFDPAAMATTAADRPGKRIKIGQIGIGHNHAAVKMRPFRKLSDHYEVVGIVEPDPEWRKKRGNDPAYKDLTWMTEEQLIELAQVIRGERENPYPLEHEILVQECLLKAFGYPSS